MERIYYLRQKYNQLKKKQYEEYIKRQNMYYRYIKKYYKEYIENQNKYYLDRKKQYEEYIKRQNMYYMYIKKCYEEYVKNQNRYYLDKKIYYEEYIKRQNNYYLYKKKHDEEQDKSNKEILENEGEYDKADIILSEFFDSSKNDSVEDNNINKDIIKNNIDSYLENNVEESLEENTEEFLGESVEEPLEENTEELLEENTEESLEENTEESLEESAEEFLEESAKEFLEESAKEFLEESAEEFLEESVEESLGESAEEPLEENLEEFLEEKAEKSLEENNEEFLAEDYNNLLKEELAKENNISTEGLYVKFPVILAEANITIPIEATIKLDKEAMEIKVIKKNLFLTDSHLIPFSSDSVDPNSGILFIAGFIRNNIEYKTKTCTTVGTEKVCGDIKQCTVEMPFNFTTRINFIRIPIFNQNTTTRELEFFTDRLQGCDNCKDPVIGRDPYEQSFISTEIFNEKPFVELVKATFIEVDIYKNQILSHETSTEQEFTQTTEKIIVNLTLKVLQKQDLRIIIE